MANITENFELTLCFFLPVCQIQFEIWMSMKFIK